MNRLKCVIIAISVAVILQPGPIYAQGKLSIRLQGGGAYISGGDINPGNRTWFPPPIEGWVQYGSYQALRSGCEVGADIIFELNPRFGVGIGAGYIGFSGYSSMSLEPELPSINSTFYTAWPRLSAFPIRTGLYLTLPWKSRLNLIANLGLSYYFSPRYSDEFYYESFPSSNSDLITTRARYKKTPIGFQGEFGVEYKVSRNLFPYLEARARYARFRGWQGTSVLELGSESPLTEEGKLYYEVVPILTRAPRLLMVQSSPPDGPDGEPRQAEIDFSGFSLQLGIRIRL